MREQSFPEKSKCPECGGEATEKSKREHHLQALGYLADDGYPICKECGNQWRIGRPVGEYEEGDDLICDSCGYKYVRIHFIKAIMRGGSLRHYKLNTKCPECATYDTIQRKPDSEGRALVGYPDITGKKGGSKPVGRPEEGD